MQAIAYLCSFVCMCVCACTIRAACVHALSDMYSQNFLVKSSLCPRDGTDVQCTQISGPVSLCQKVYKKVVSLFVVVPNQNESTRTQ